MEIDLSYLNARWENAEAETIIREARFNVFGAGVVMSSHFNPESALMLSLATTVDPEMPVIYLDDGKENLSVGKLCEKFGLNLRPFPYQGEEQKLEALQGALRALGARAVLHGIRAYQDDDVRKEKEIIELGEDGFYRIHPILKWPRKKVMWHLVALDLPPQPREEKLPTCELHRFAKRA